MKKSKIEWTDATWNPVIGCTKVSPGCKHCYAETMHRRLTEMAVAKYAQPFAVVHPWEQDLGEPLRWEQPRRIFVNSMSDLFHEDIPFEYLQRVFDLMAWASQHQFQVLTKRSKYLWQVARILLWPSNVWMGVSVESANYVHRAHDLANVPAAVRFLSIEPLLGPIPNLPLDGIHWVIVGGESGPQARPMDEAWVLDLRDQCCRAGIPFFFKQWGGKNKKAAGRVLAGRTWDEMPLSRGERPEEPR